MGKRRIETQDFEVLRASLRALPPSGPGGFEGLLSSLLSELTSRRFFLASAGAQQGQDLSTLRYLDISTVEEALTVVTRYFDERHLQPKTRLVLEELLGGEPK